MKDILKVSFVIIGTMIGAGFASGQEIILFFNCYGAIGLLGIIVSCIITGIIVYRVFCILNQRSISSYREFLNIITSTSKSSNSKYYLILKNIVSLFLLISFYIMIAGFCAYFYQELNIPIWLSATLIAILCYITFHRNIQGVISINGFLIPFLIIFILYLGIKNISFAITHYSQQVYIQMSNGFNFSWLISSILYSSYNSILLIPILIPLRTLIDTKSKIMKTSLTSSTILALLGISIFCLLLRGESSLDVELPMVQIVKEFGNIYTWTYGIVIIVAIFTSVISSGYGFLSDYTQSSKKYKKLVIFLCASSILIAPIGFANLVNVWYPFFGTLGIFQIILIKRECTKLKIRNKNVKNRLNFK